LEMKNKSYVSEFILVGFSPFLQKFLFVLFGTTYIITIAGNVVIIIVTRLDIRLKSPMYFFLVNLALIEMLYTTSIIPNTLKNLIDEEKYISYAGCFIQMFTYIAMGGSECTLLSTMAYDRYVAICHPLLYTTIMSQSLCFYMTLACWTIGFLNSLIHTVLTSMLPFCHQRLLNHYFCEVPPLLKISCKDTYINELVVFFIGGFVIVGSLALTLISYIFVIAEVLKIPGLSGKWKTFSTCSSHLTVVSIFFGTVIFTYLRPTTHSSIDHDHVISLVYGVVTPLINPIIYTFRNKEFQRAFRMILQTRHCLFDHIKPNSKTEI
uniref:Olfactory receptor n=1 Tax=Xenopus tropicalis TaxID=8364 RepID=A0A803JAV4_XENTR